MSTTGLYTRRISGERLTDPDPPHEEASCDGIIRVSEYEAVRYKSDPPLRGESDDILRWRHHGRRVII
jgi:hypothetical protein